MRIARLSVTVLSLLLFVPNLSLSFESRPTPILDQAPPWRLQPVPAVKAATAREARELPRLLGEAAQVLTDEELGAIAALADFISKNYIDPIESKRLYYGAMRGMARELDPHSQFYSPPELKALLEDLKGSFTGIGAGLGKKEDGGPVPITHVMPNSPAETGGVKAGDLITEVDGVPAGPMTTEDVVRRIRGAAGTTVTVTIMRPDSAAQAVRKLTLTLTRAEVRSNNVFSKMLVGGVGYVYFSQFQDDTSVNVLAQVRALKAQGAGSLVIDVRHNPGGSLQSVVDMTAAFLKSGQVVVTTKNRRGRIVSFTAKKDGEFKDLPVKVLINGYSASASEILAGALQDHGRARVYGSKTYGKGSAQSIIPLDDGSALKLTVERWFTPSGRSIERTKAGGGVSPDVAVALDEAEEAKIIGGILRELNGVAGEKAADPVLEKALAP